MRGYGNDSRLFFYTTYDHDGSHYNYPQMTVRYEFFRVAFQACILSLERIQHWPYTREQNIFITKDAALFLGAHIEGRMHISQKENVVHELSPDQKQSTNHKS